MLVKNEVAYQAQEILMQLMLTINRDNPEKSLESFTISPVSPTTSEVVVTFRPCRLEHRQFDETIGAWRTFRSPYATADYTKLFDLLPELNDAAPTETRTPT